ncbi:MAG: GatB/YqeY domain-containing protein [Candidatus Omnitrophica bacterium]|nr:GatB/YqeY domain-containing protein [Candidatus Omnitrophota bacterium]
MNILQKVDEDLKESMRARDEVRMNTLRGIKSSVKMLLIEKIKKEASHEEVISVIQKQVKQRRDSIEEFKKGNRPDLVQKEERELKILESYLPAQMSPQELEAIVSKIIAQAGAATKAEMGKVMKLVMEETKGRADGKAVSSLVSSKLK